MIFKAVISLKLNQFPEKKVFDYLAKIILLIGRKPGSTEISVGPIWPDLA